VKEKITRLQEPIKKKQHAGKKGGRLCNHALALAESSFGE